MQAEAVVRGEHTLYMIVEASDEALVRNYMAPFAIAGSLDVYPASTCAGVISRGGRGAAYRPRTDSYPRSIPERHANRPSTTGWWWSTAPIP
jgi:hypothetical protein